MGVTMTLKYYRDAANKFLGGFDVPPNDPPVGGVEVPLPPPHADFYTWNAGTQAWDRDVDADDRQAESDFKGQFEDDRLRRLIFEIEFDQENRLRVLEGRPTLPDDATGRGQYKMALLNLLKTL